MSLSTLLLQAATTIVENQDYIDNTSGFEESYLSLILRGGWILVPIFLLSLLSIAIIVGKAFSLSGKGKHNDIWLSRLLELIHEDKIEKALDLSTKLDSSEAIVVREGLKDFNQDVEIIEEAMELEARIEINRLEKHMNFLAITASIAPMLGFLGTIFGVIKIFYSISMTADISIANISEGLYEKMISSGSGLLVGIIAFTGYHLLNTKIDNIVINIDKTSNTVLKAIKAVKSGHKINS